LIDIEIKKYGETKRKQSSSVESNRVQIEAFITG